MAENQPQSTEQEWEEVRNAFQDSIMVDTKLTSLAQNIGTCDWPLKAEDETPAKYIFYTWEELLTLPEIQKEPQRIDSLIEILRETAAFDDPYSDMVDQFEQASEDEDAVLKNLEKYEIPRDYPLELTGLSSDTLGFCEAEEIHSLGAFARFSQTMAQNIVIGGDFRELLNSLTHFDAETVATFLPYRPKEKGLHLPEGIAIELRRYNDTTRKALLKKYGGQISADDAKKIKRFTREELTDIEQRILEHVEKLFAALPQRKDELILFVKGGGDLTRYVLPLNDPQLEPLVAAYLREAIGSVPTDGDSTGAGTRKRGFFARLFGRG